MHKMLATSYLHLPYQPDAVPNVEVFRTNIRTPREAGVVVTMVEAYFAGLRITLDLDDCDRILRVQDRHSTAPLPVSGIRRLVAALGYQIEVLAE